MYASIPSTQTALTVSTSVSSISSEPNANSYNFRLYIAGILTYLDNSYIENPRIDIKINAKITIFLYSVLDLYDLEFCITFALPSSLAS